MGAHTNIIIITTTTTTNRPRPSGWHRPLVLGLAVCALVVPATASASPPGPSVSGLGGDRASSSDSSQSGGGAAAGHAQRTPTELGQAPARARVSSGGGIAGVYQLEKAGRTKAARRAQQAASEPTLVSGGPGDPADGFDWGSAAVGAGAVLALGALAGAVLLTVRRRTATAPSVSTG
jgi:hypothetical protein